MAAYSAVACFRQTLKQLLDSDKLHPDFPTPQIESLHENVCAIQSSLDRIRFVPKSWRPKMNDLQGKIRDAVYLGQDKVEYLITGSSSQISESISFEKIRVDIAAAGEEAKQTARNIENDPRADNLFSENPEPTKFDYSGKEKIVGQKKDFRLIQKWLELDDKKLLLIPITGLPGIGKTTLVRSIYDAQLLKRLFNLRAWVTVSQEYNYQEIFTKLLNTLESKSYQAGHYAMQGDEQALRNRLHQELYNQKYLIVIDDIWEPHVWDRIKLALPDKENGSRIIFTTRQQDVAEFMMKSSNLLHKMQPLNRDKSWKLLCYKTFTYEVCEPYRKDIDKVCPNLKDIGRKIAENCKGLPLSIVVVGGLLSQQKDREEHWRGVEENTVGAATTGDESYLDVLSLSYDYLPGKLKGCFLYMAAFPEDTDIPVSKLIKLWVAEGFLPDAKYGQDLEFVAQDCLEQLVRKNLISVRKQSSNGGIKFCGMENSLRELAERESKKEKFIYSTNKYGKKQKEEDVQMQRRVSFHRNILVCLEELYDSTRSIKHARSLLYVGPHHHHPLPFCLTFDLLRVLDAFTLYFVDFPDEFLKLIHLTYLSLTYNHEIPPEISNLQKLQVLMVRRQPKIIFVGVSFMPDEIWEMPNLRHLWFTETDMPSLPVKVPENRALLLNLQMANVNAVFFTDEILDNMPNVKKLSMWMEEPDEIKFDLTKMSKLEFFKFVVLNPVHKKGIVVEKEKFFVKTLRRLHLSGTGLPWDYMRFVAENLEDLQVLKLKELAFHGETWSLDYDFKKLKYLIIEFLEFKTWEARMENFPRLQKLIVRHCYKLEEIPGDFQYIGPLELMEMVDCSIGAVESLEDLRDRSYNCQVNIFSSWE